MTGLVLCEPTELYNILNQVTKLSRLTEPNYLCLLDVRTKREYDESHVMTALLVKKCSRPGDTVEYKLLLIPCSCISELLWCSGDRQLQILLGSPGFFRVWVRLPVLLLAPAENRSSALVYLTVSALSCSEIAPRLQRAGEYLIPESVDLECVKYCVVYDNNTSSLEIILKNNSDDDNTDDDNGGVVLGAALECGRALTHLTRHPVHILRGGYECFSAMYHFFRTQKSIWMPQELDAFQPYPVEIVPGKIYLGNFRQACDPKIQKDLKIKAHVNVSMEIGPFFVGDADKLLHIPIEDSPEANISPFLRHLCHFIEMHLELGSVVLVFSTMGISRSCAAILAYLMHRNGQTLKMLNHLCVFGTNPT